MPPSIPFTLKRSTRAKHIRIIIRGNDVMVTAPKRTSKKIIDDFVQSKRHWIDSHLQTIPKDIPWIMPPGVQSMKFEACKARAKKFVKDRVAHYNQYYQFDYNRITVKDMKTQWGSCSQYGNLNFHYLLLFLPLELADYVIVHEICHLKEMNHSKRFWELVGEQVPEHKGIRRRLRTYHNGLL